MALVKNLCLNAVPRAPPQPFEKSETEGIFVQASEASRDSNRLQIFVRFKNTKAAIASLVSSIAEDSYRSLSSLLAHNRGLYHCAEDEQVFRSPLPNNSHCRLGGSKISKRACVSISNKK